jgi:hypothetical protein
MIACRHADDDRSSDDLPTTDYDRDLARAAVLAYLAAELGQGRAMMPRKATYAMSDAGVAALGKDRDNIGYTTTPRLWAAMFDAAPPAAQEKK